MTCRCCINSAFRWAEHRRDSLFVSDPTFTVGAKAGKTMSVVSSEAARKYERQTGRSLGSIRGLSDRGDRHIEQSEYVRRKR